MLFGGSALTHWTGLTFFLIALVGTTETAFRALTTSALLQHSPDNLRGRVFGIFSLDRAATSGGSAAAGFAVVFIGPSQAQMLFGAALLLVAISWSVLGKGIREVD